MEKIFEFLQNFSISYGTGSFDDDLLIFSGIVTLLILFLKRDSQSQQEEIRPTVNIEPVLKAKESQTSLEVPKIEQKIEKVAAVEPLAARLKGTRKGLLDRIRSAFSGKDILDSESIQELEALLVGSDLGIKTVGKLLTALKTSLQKGEQINDQELLAQLKNLITDILQSPPASEVLKTPRADQYGPKVLMLVGVNGVGKTTTAAKLAQFYKQGGARVVLAAADTFRAAAVQQLQEWGAKIDVPVISGADQGKPATVVFDAMLKAKELQADILIIDTAGRLHTKTSLMQELAGVRSSIVRHHEGGAPHEVLLVVDGTTGQNALSQAKEFHQATQLTGVVVTKLDGTAKGGIVVAIKEELNIPLRFIGVGESFADLREFNITEFVDALCNSSEGDQLQPKESPMLSAHAVTRRKRREQAI